jgi:NAD(P)-dependent dehydrogenase (short-subunit alcohol dehydrogenase family)
MNNTDPSTAIHHTEPALGLSLRGLNAVITGGTTGIGRATAELFHRSGAKVMITGCSPASLEAARRELPSAIEVVAADASVIADSEQLALRAQAHLKTVDVLFLNAGIAGLRPFEAVDEAFYSRHMDINVKGVVFTLQKFLPLLAPNASVIVNTSVADVKGTALMSIYSASKGAIAALVRSLAVELAPRRIRINSISPAMISTPIQAKFGLPAEVLAKAKRDHEQRIPLGRFGEAEEVANLALFLASRAASYITGTEIEVDGGLHIA